MNLIKRFLKSEMHAGLKIALTGLVVAMLCWFPLLLYVPFGPADGNPIGLGLLAMIGTLVGVFAIGIGLLWWVFGMLMRPRGD